ncbi:hypothetical protein [Bowmanella dokdonensis]|uniref:Uncharacterized protein n=1 Tax=Bowmanella dokdonensis TaxID=751969 RepID=A0A939IRH0_9ALTE|nr:hypothetical protein [Bowmanella dokdonensis]MBN7826094.1 hypothetical protein [Bowmanella dokdonensis]
MELGETEQMDAAKQAMQNVTDNVLLFVVVLVGLYAVSGALTLAMEKGLGVSRTLRSAIWALLFIGSLYLVVTNGLLPRG